LRRYSGNAVGGGGGGGVEAVVVVGAGSR